MAFSSNAFQMASVSSLVMLFLSPLVFLSSAEEKKQNVTTCPTSFCEHTLGNIGFPYKNVSRSECGLYTVDCSKPVPKIQFKEGGHWFGIERISQSNFILINETSSTSHLDPRSCKSIESFKLPDSTSFSRLRLTNSWTLFNCSRSLGISVPRDFNRTSCGGYDIYYTSLLYNNFPLAQRCSIIQLPPLSRRRPNNEILFSTNFTVDVYLSGECLDCHYYSAGQCKTNSNNEFQCSTTIARSTPKGKSSNKAEIVAVPLGVAVIILLCCWLRKKFSSNKLIFLWKKHDPANESIEAFLRNYGPIQVRRYSYSEIMKMTNFFATKLGQGGFGSVYKGKLDDGCGVAVKVLNQSKGSDGEEFINEVAAISRTSHVNIVSLLGFCFEGAKRALIYEFMPNGSLEKFVFNENSIENSHQLDWETCYQILLGVARGLEYLHRGCNTRILHFDIKPHNILLDGDFVPKISDFGLARICTRKESLISMLGPRGTIGYVAPEVFSRNFGGISHKSDVYSYGMMTLEIVGGRKNANVRAENTSEIYFPHWIYKRLELDEELQLKRIANEEDRVNVRKMIIVGLWCIQTDPSNRPAMSKVIEMLEGSLYSLHVPPKPFLSSPPRSPPAVFSSTFESLNNICS